MSRAGAKRGIGAAVVLAVALGAWVLIRARTSAIAPPSPPHRSALRSHLAALHAARPRVPTPAPPPAPPQHAGALAIHGVVRDVRGTLIGGATITVDDFECATSTPAIATSAADGTFEAWVPAGSFRATARAAGFADREAYGTAPELVDATLAIELTPESVIAGIVIDAATKHPIDDALVSIAERSARTGPDGAFRIDRLEPGRYTPRATAIGAYGETPESVLAGFGATVSAVTIETHPVAVVAGHIVIAAAPGGPGPAFCPAGEGEVILAKAWSSHAYHATTLVDGFVVLEGVTPGEYEASVSCRGYLSAVPYPNVVVGDSDVEDVTWPVRPGAHLTGHVRTAGHDPVPDATVNTRGAGGELLASAVTDATGAFVVDGVAPGAIEVVAVARGFAWSEPVSAVAVLAAPVAVELTVVPAPPDPVIAKPARVGTLAGTVRTPAGAPIPDAYVELDTEDRDRRPSLPAPLLVSRDGSFHFTNLAEGTYSVRAYRTGAEETRLAGIATGTQIALVLQPTGEITGTVTTPDGAPVDDVIVEADSGSAMQQTREEHVFHTHGAFAFRDLPAGTYELVVDGDQRATVAVSIGAGEHRSGVTLVSEPYYSLRGRLVSSSGAPLVGWRVQLDYTAHTIERGSGTVVISDGITAVTDASGAFLLHHIPAGPAALSAANVALALDAPAIALAALTVSSSQLELGTLTVPAGSAP